MEKSIIQKVFPTGVMKLSARFEVTYPVKKNFPKHKSEKITSDCKKKMCNFPISSGKSMENNFRPKLTFPLNRPKKLRPSSTDRKRNFKVSPLGNPEKFN